MERLRITLHGAVQGAGFRPFVYRLAAELGLTGWVLNSAAGLIVEVEGEATAAFRERLERERPEASVVLSSEISVLAPAGYTSFEIRQSDATEAPTAAILPDLAACPECLAETFERGQRRFGYPFTNCTRCGPRYSIVTGIPYDRPNTTMARFAMCADCRREYENPADRRFHAQPIACPACGPRLGSGGVEQAAEVIRGGGVVALQGIGGYQLLCDARNEAAVARLRERKHREAKPLAVMMPSLEDARRCCVISAGEERVLGSSAAPIMLLEPLPGAAEIAANVSDASPFLGVMLPYSPLHHLLLRECGFPIVATSGNVSGDPIVTTEDEASRVLAPIADLVVSHDRPIARPVDDSVVRVSRGGVAQIRRARGYAPLPVPVAADLPPTLAVGGHMKNTIAVAAGSQVFVSQHIGDLDTLASRRAFEQAIEDLCRLYAIRPEVVACDLHPEYASTRWALASGLRVVGVQHHEAHAASCAAENDIRGEFLGVSWDGTGYGHDHTIWGGEFFFAGEQGFERIRWLRPFGLPGGEAAIREGWRSAASLLAGCGRYDRMRHPKAELLRRVIERRVHCPLTSSIGRLFDAVAALAGVAVENRFEGQAAMMLERTADRAERASYPLPLSGRMLDWAPMVEAILGDFDRGVGAEAISARFHNGLADAVLAVAVEAGVGQVALSGGVFQNALLTDLVVERLERRRIRVFTHQRVPANDGGLALGQAVRWPKSTTAG